MVGCGTADFDVLAGGLWRWKVNRAFEDYWYSGLAFDVDKLNKPADDQHYRNWRTRIEADHTTFRAQIEKEDSQLAVQRLVDGGLRPYYDGGEVLYDPPDKVVSDLFDQSHNMVSELVPLMESAQQELLIASPYFIPGQEGLEMFKRLRERGVDVTILSNSLRANDVLAVHAGYMQYRKPLLEMGVKLYELRQQPGVKTDRSLLGSSHASLHAKTFIIDRKRVFVGSFNLDPRSAIHNTEMGVVFDSPEYAGTVYDKVEDYLSLNAYQVTLEADGNLRWTEVEEDGSQESFTHDPGSSWWERTLVTVISWLPVEWLL
ncbi:MAG: phospholipase D-like domain-containing protein [Thiolinea sp.]